MPNTSLFSLPAIHEMTGNNPRAWHASVETLHESAKRIKQRNAASLPDGTELMLATNGVYAMLLGYAIECALDSGRRPPWVYPVKLGERTYPDLPEFRRYVSAQYRANYEGA